MTLRYNLRPASGLHLSWMPVDWPLAASSKLRSLSPRSEVLLGAALVQRHVLPDAKRWEFESGLARLSLIDGASLRRLAFYMSLCAHASLMRARWSSVGSALRRQARRIDADAVEFVLERTPELVSLQMSEEQLRSNPRGIGRLMFDRGYRLLIGLATEIDEACAERVALKLPRRAVMLGAARLTAVQREDLGELVIACLVPERLAQWDWLF
ncbi:SctK family type III secretion system sorting platform protein [Roseateles sp. NT4]|uniref:SctK family type III secretion system sorting platform protein n=1 Tax=Roseateles sp. NT4 TaxID=3453715 RepID=UPI003EEB454E